MLSFYREEDEVLNRFVGGNRRNKLRTGLFLEYIHFLKAIFARLCKIRKTGKNIFRREFAHECSIFLRMVFIRKLSMKIPQYYDSDERKKYSPILHRDIVKIRQEILDNAPCYVRNFSRDWRIRTRASSERDGILSDSFPFVPQNLRLFLKILYPREMGFPKSVLILQKDQCQYCSEKFYFPLFWFCMQAIFQHTNLSFEAHCLPKDDVVPVDFQVFLLL